MELIGLRVRLDDGSEGTIVGGQVNVDMDTYLEQGVPVDEVVVVGDEVGTVAEALERLGG